MREIAVPSPGYGRGVGRHRRRSEAARRADEARTAEEVVDRPGEWEPGRNDLRGVDDKERRIRSVRHADYAGDDPEWHHSPEARSTWEAAERLGTVAPVQGNPSLDPATGDMVAVSYMAGYSDDSPIGHDSIQGVDRLVTGEIDATRDLRVESNTPGPPLRLGPSESSFSDDVGAGTHSLGGDWCRELCRMPGEDGGGWL